MNTSITKDEQYQILTGRIFMYVSRFLNQNFKNAGLIITKDQWTIMAVLWKEDGVSQQVLAEATGRDKPSITRLLDNLEKSGYLKRKPDKKDRRQKLILLTPKGKDIREEVTHVVEETFKAITQGLTLPEMELVRKTFRKIYQNIEKENE